LYNSGFESLAMVKLFDPRRVRGASASLADPIAFSDSDRVRSAAHRQGQARCCPHGVRRRLPFVGRGLGAAARTKERHINTIRALLSHALHKGAGFDRDAGKLIDFEQIDGSIRTAYLPVVTLKKDSED
jgi:hypothetical protein